MFYGLPKATCQATCQATFLARGKLGALGVSLWHVPGNCFMGSRRRRARQRQATFQATLGILAPHLERARQLFYGLPKATCQATCQATLGILARRGTLLLDCGKLARDRRGKLPGALGVFGVNILGTCQVYSCPCSVPSPLRQACASFFHCP